MLTNSFSPTSQGKPLGCNRLGSWPNQHLRKITHLHIHAAILWIYGGCWGEVVVGVVWFCSYHPRQSTPVGGKTRVSRNHPRKFRPHKLLEIFTRFNDKGMSERATPAFRLKKIVGCTWANFLFNSFQGTKQFCQFDSFILRRGHVVATFIFFCTCARFKGLYTRN